MLAEKGIEGLRLRFHKLINKYPSWQKEELRKLRLIKQVLSKF
jgi:hypothetical protein